MLKMKTFKNYDELYAYHQKKLEDLKGHSESTLYELHDHLINELDKIGNACDTGIDHGDGSEDFILDRTVGDSLPIGIVVEAPQPGLITAVTKALDFSPVGYSVLLDLEDAEVIIERDGSISGLIDEGDLESIVNIIR